MGVMTSVATMAETISVEMMVGMTLEGLVMVEMTLVTTAVMTLAVMTDFRRSLRFSGWHDVRGGWVRLSKLHSLNKNSFFTDLSMLFCPPSSFHRWCDESCIK